MEIRQRPIIVVAIPARDESGLVGACLEALDAQVGAQLNHIVLFANNCTDGTAAAALAVPLQRGTTLHVIERTCRRNSRMRVMRAGWRCNAPRRWPGRTASC